MEPFGQLLWHPSRVFIDVLQKELLSPSNAISFQATVIIHAHHTCETGNVPPNTGKIFVQTTTSFSCEDDLIIK